MIMILSVIYIAGAEDGYKYILCNPKPTNHVAIRRNPRKGSEETGRLDCGDRIYTDGRKLNGYIHILGMTEDGEGWVHQGYVVDDEPVIEKCGATVAANGRVKARRYINGKRIAWLDVCTELTVYARSEEWAVTNRGYVQTKYLEVWYDY
jgi:hypothetical protein